MGKLVFVWDNFGPLHADRCNSVATKFERDHQVVGLELAGQSKLYDWLPEGGAHFQKITLFNENSVEDIPFPRRFTRTLRACLSMGQSTHYFMCHYQDPAIFLTAVSLRMLGRRVYTMGCSKFDDYPRRMSRELIKSLMYLPYSGAIA